MKQSDISIRQILSFYWQHAIRYPRKVWGILLIAPVTLYFHQFLPPVIAARVIDKLSAGEFSPDRLWQDFGHDLIVFTVSCMVGGMVLWRIFIYFNWSLEALVMRDITRESFDQYMKLDTSFHSNSFGGSLVSQTNKLSAAYMRIADAFQFQIYNLFIALTLSSFILWGKSQIFVLLLWLVTALFFVFSVYLSREPRRRSGIEASMQNKVTGYLADAITNVMAIKSFASDKSERKRFSEVTERSRNATNAVMWATLRKDSGSALITEIIYAGALFVAVVSVVRYSADVSTVFLMLSFTADIARRLWEFSTTSLRNINRGLGDAREGIAALQTDPKVQDPAKPEKPRIRQGAIIFKSVDFTHDGGNDALFKGFDLDVKPGEKIGLVGHSGSGKTSLTKLLLRYADVDGGEILIDGQNVAKITQNDLRQAISYVPQEPLLFHRSIRENIAYGKPEASLKQIKAIARQANAAEFIDTLPDGYGTLVGERGVKLSGGQRQRVAIARAMLKNAPILVLDEATSALDSESEVLIQDALWKLMEGRTAIVIAHRLSTIQKMDRIVVLSDGRIVEQGSHKQLLARKGTYAKLWAHQSGGFIED